MKKLKVLVAGGAKHYARLISPREDVFRVEDADLVIFTGGADVDPALYGEKLGSYTRIYPERDKREIEVFEKCVKNGVAMLGICRGSQFLTVMNGGKLIQHVVGHGIGGTHSITTKDGKEFQITSTHHQMLYPFDMTSPDEYILWAWSTERRSPTYLNGSDQRHPMTYGEYPEPEMILYPKTRSFCIQGHPENQLDSHPELIKYIQETIHAQLFQLVS